MGRIFSVYHSLYTRSLTPNAWQMDHYKFKKSSLVSLILNLNQITNNQQSLKNCRKELLSLLNSCMSEIFLIPLLIHKIKQPR